MVQAMPWRDGHAWMGSWVEPWMVKSLEGLSYNFTRVHYGLVFLSPFDRLQTPSSLSTLPVGAVADRGFGALLFSYVNLLYTDDVSIVRFLTEFLACSMSTWRRYHAFFGHFLLAPNGVLVTGYIKVRFGGPSPNNIHVYVGKGLFGSVLALILCTFSSSRYLHLVWPSARFNTELVLLQCFAYHFVFPLMLWEKWFGEGACVNLILFGSPNFPLLMVIMFILH
jgi:hypothetical protein